jgi:hypothetical protein
MRHWLPLAVLSAALLVPVAALAEDDEAKPEAEKTDGETKPETPAETPKLVAAAKGPFAPEVEVAGSFAPESFVEVVYRPKVYGAELEVVESAPAGPVTKGATLVRFDTTKVDDQIRAAEADLAVEKEQLAKTIEENKLADRATEVALAKADSDAKRSEEAYRVFHDVEAPLRRLETEHRIQGARDNILDQEEELAQLEKMYKADELTEETEEIVLKRSKRQLERSRTSLGFHLQRQKLLLEIELPREDEALDLARKKAAIDWERMRTTAPLALAERRVTIEKARLALERQSTALERLRADREAMTVLSPTAGFAVPGAFWNGKWVSLDDNAKVLRPGRRAPANHPLYTVFAPGAVRVRVVVPEALVFRVKPGGSAKVVPNADPTISIAAQVAEVDPVAQDGQHEVWLKPEKVDARLMPGQPVKATLTGLEKRDAITLPATAVKKDGEKGVVRVWTDGKAVVKEVKVGGEAEGRIEIVEGLEAGTEVLETAPAK